ncbi:hypothetical protein COV19_04885 [Candidatus Woesearchaeota archaeon CG10_big_fil_rev_8_21_14_0_10_44_13]|nr:MAG: hypothetical protein COV19_04885 [Candidatus Woesearchaeota archaeon CG10_big_fil_rev_8_21_14_0_10_44_13]
MSVLDIIKKRRSIRRYLDVPVEWDKIVQLLEAGRYAPSSGNIQEWKFVVVSDKTIKRKVAEACLKQYWVEAAPAIIVICSMVEKQEQFYGERGRNVYTYINCAAAAENMLITATELGLGSCLVGAFDESMMCEALNIPTRARPILVLTFGYPGEKVPVPPKMVLEGLVFLQTYACRIRNVNMVLWDVSLEIEKKAREGKEIVERGASKLHERIKHHVKKIKDRFKEDMDE